MKNGFAPLLLVVVDDALALVVLPLRLAAGPSTNATLLVRVVAAGREPGL